MDETNVHKARLDTGGERTISAPLSVVQEFYSQAEQSFTVDGCLIVPCNATLPDLELHIGNGTAIIYSRDLVGNPYQNGSKCHFIPATFSSAGSN